MGVLQFLLVLTVLITHVGKPEDYNLIGSTRAVELFFIVSGFHMAMGLSERYQSKKNFYIKRLFRIFPLYWFCLCLLIDYSLLSYFRSGYWAWLSGWIDLVKILSLPTLIIGVLMNILVIGQDWLFFLGPVNDQLVLLPDFTEVEPRLHTMLLMPQSWFLSLVLMFYLIAPYLNKLKSYQLAVVGCMGLGVRFLVAYYNLAYDPWEYRLFPAQIIFFILGMITYRWLVFLRINRQTGLKTNWWLGILLIIYVLIFRLVVLDSWIKTWFLYTLTIVTVPFLFEITKSVLLDRRLGELAYPIFLVHLFASNIIDLIIPGLERLTVNPIMKSLAGSLIIGVFFIRMIQVPLIHWLNQKTAAID